MKRAKNIQEIFDALSIKQVVDKVHLPHKVIREKYEVKKFRAKDYDEAMSILTKYYQFHFAKWTRTTPYLSEDIAFANVRLILDKEKGGFVVAMKNAIRGREGGLISLVNKIAQSFEEESLQKYIRYVIDHMLNRLDFNQMVLFAQQYLNQYAKYLLPEEEVMTPYELAANLEGIIKYHIQVLNSYRQMLQ